jgi:hypothetical protein
LTRGARSLALRTSNTSTVTLYEILSKRKKVNWKTKKGKGKGVPKYDMNAYWGTRGIALLILNLGIRCRRVVSFTPWLIYPRGSALGTH